MNLACNTVQQIQIKAMDAEMAIWTSTHAVIRSKTRSGFCEIVVQFFFLQKNDGSSSYFSAIFRKISYFSEHYKEENENRLANP